MNTTVVSKTSHIDNSFIVNPVYDSFFFIFSPLIALTLGYLIYKTGWGDITFIYEGEQRSFTNTFIGTLIMAHLVIVFFRSHGNNNIVKQFPVRFFLIPVILYIGMVSSLWVLVSMSVLATWWDVYHSGLQTFGLGRIYDAKVGNKATVGRRLDYFLNLYLYAGPILAGITLIDHIEDFEEFQAVGSIFFTAVPAYTMHYQRYLLYFVVGTGIPFFIYYLYAYWRYTKLGYAVSPQKVMLLVSTGLCSIYSWGFNSFGEAFFIMNFFHAIQYFAIVWHNEKHNMSQLFRVHNLPLSKFITLIIFLGLAFAYGTWAEFTLAESDYIYALLILISILHFWYDGFIWSVRKKQV
ncbi:hypothetical protein [Spartinivicinus ruber]|uniref:hypothetical protein n=1 Tax=Spartinivicinus ruber TaxID=2683272 RepID=UPI0013D0221A|nr:hypothetical protein [Spartinivicinus ruber]